MMTFRRAATSFAAMLVGFAQVIAVVATPALADGPSTQIVSDNPADFTPNVVDGQVEAITQVGNRIIIGGTFSQVADAAVNGGTVHARTNIAAFDATTGLVDTGFNPVLDGSVSAIIAASDGTSIYATGVFNQVNGTNTRKIARLDIATGQKVAGFNVGGVNGQIKDVRLIGSTLYVAGLFTTIGGQARSLMASLDAATGAVTSRLDLAFAGTQNGGVTNVYKIEATPAGDRMLAIGNFATVNGLDRRQVVMLDLTGPTVTVAAWQTNFYTSACSNSFDAYVRDLDISEDGTFAVISTTGAYRVNTSCDTIARFEVATDAGGLTPTWTSYTGGDTTYAVEIARGAVYAGGHMRWINNPHAGDNIGAGAVPREGIVALDVVNGLPFSWNPGRTRGVGVFDFFVTDTGMWAGSDTDRWGGELRSRLAFFPWNGGATVARDLAGELPNDVYLVGASTSTAPGDASVLYRINAGGPALPSGDDGPGWAADTSSTSTLRNSGSNVSSYTGSAQFVTSSVPATDFDRAPLALFATERWDPASGQEMQWSIPVAAGTPIQVRLYLANRCNCTKDPGRRVFSVQLDSATVVDSLDLSADPGHSIGTMRSFNIVSDGTVNITFIHQTENPLVNGIEIVRTDLPAGGAISAQDDVSHRFYDGVNAPEPTSVAAGSEAFGYSRGAFIVNNTVYTGWANGSMSRRTFDGASWGSPQNVVLYGNTFIDDLPNVTGLFYEPNDERIYYTLSSNAGLFWRAFTPESHTVGASRFSASGDVASLNPARVQGMFLSGGDLFFADRTSGNLLRIGLASGAVTGSATTVDTSADWRARGLFVWTGVPSSGSNLPPLATFTSACTEATCTFDARSSSDPDGSIVSYSWNFGDGQTGAGAAPAHTYAAGGTFTVTLTVTDNAGATHAMAADVTVGTTTTSVAFRSSTSYNGASSSPTVTVPGDVETSDGLVLIVSANKDTTIGAPAGWTLLGTQTDGSPDMRSSAFARTAVGGTAGSPVLVTLGQSAKVSIVLLAYSGVGSSPVSASASAPEPGNAATHMTPAAPVAASGSLVINYWADKTGGNTGWVVPGVVTTRAESLGSGGGQISVVVGDAGPVAAGTWVGATATSSTTSGKAIMWSIVIAPA